MPNTFDSKKDQFLKNCNIQHLNIVIEESDNDNLVEWKNVKKDISTKSWGEYIENGILEPMESKEKYKINDYKNLRTYVKNNFETDKFRSQEIDLSDTNWNTKDKIMGLISISVMFGFIYDTWRNILYLGVDYLIEILLLNNLPFYIIVFLLGIATTAISLIIKDNVENEHRKEIKNKIDELRDDDKKFGLPDDATDYEKDKLMELQNAQIKTSIQPLVWSLPITIPVIIWMFVSTNVIGVGETVVFPFIGEVNWSSSVIGPLQAWILWYIISSVVGGSLIKQIYNYLN